MPSAKSLLPLLLLLLAAAAGAGEKPQKIAFASLPSAVQKAVQAVLDKGKVGQVEKDTEDSIVTYSVEIIRSGGEREYTFAPDGTLVSVEVSLGETPAPVQAAIRSQAGHDKIAGIEKDLENGTVTYEVTVEKGGHESTFTVSAEGRLLSVEFTLAETPPSVQATIKSALGPAAIDHLEKSFAPPPVTFEVDFTRAGHKHSLSVGEDGSLVSLDLDLAETPAPVQAAIRAQVGRGTILRLEKSVEEGKTSFEVESTLAGRAQTFRVGEKGHLLSVRVALAELPAPARQAVAEMLGDATLLSIDQSKIKKGKVFPYEIHAQTRDGQPYDFLVGPHGRFLGTDD
jgi:uncharacterized membrane protein YkoI